MDIEDLRPIFLFDALSDEQLAEVRRRRAKSDPNRIPFDEVFERFKRFRAHGA